MRHATPRIRPTGKSSPAGTIKTWLAVAAFAAALGLTGYRTVKDFTVPGRIDPARNGMKDFRDAIYYPVAAFVEGISPYHAGYVEFHPENCEFPAFMPSTFLVHLPFGFLPFRVAAGVYFFVSAGLVILLAVLALKFCGLEVRADAVFALAALIVLSRPGHINLYLGQLGLQMALGTMLALHFSKHKPWIAGLGLALTTIKPNFAVPLALLMLCRRDYRTVLIGLVVGGLGALVGATILAVAYGDLGEFVGLFVKQYTSLSNAPAIPTVVITSGRIDVCALAIRMLETQPGGAANSLLMLFCLGIGCAGVLATRQTVHAERADSLSGALICLTVLTCVYHQIYDAMLLVVPLLAAAMARSESWRQVPAGFRRGLVALAVLPAANYLATRMAVGAIDVPGMPWREIMSLNGSLLLIALAACTWLALRGAAASHLALASAQQTP